MSALDERLAAIAVAPLADSPLRVLSADEVAEAAPTTTPRRALHAWRGTWIPAAGLASAAATVAAVMIATSPFTESAQGLPILEAPSVDGSVIRAQIKAPSERLDYRDARQVTTPAGTGYAVPSIDGTRICISSPDPDARGTFGTACGSVAATERDGLILERAGDRGTNARATSTITMVLPLGASGARVTSGGRTFTPSPQAGVISFDLTGPGSLTFRKRGTTVHHQFQGPFSKPTSYTVDCGGYSRTFTELPMRSSGGKPAQLDRERACR